MKTKTKMPNSNALIVFIKNPVLGKVKTRLAKDIGDKAALEVYSKLLDITRENTNKVNSTRYLYYADWINDKDDWPLELYHKRVQSNGDLGQKMKSAFVDVFNEHNRIVIVGSDCPDISSAIIESAFNKLGDSDVVFGPSQDGGYYLLGLKGLIPEIFENIPWSTKDVLKSTIDVIISLNLNYELIEELNDIDTIEDLEGMGWYPTGSNRSTTS